MITRSTVADAILIRFEELREILPTTTTKTLTSDRTLFRRQLHFICILLHIPIIRAWADLAKPACT